MTTIRLPDLTIHRSTDDRASVLVWSWGAFVIGFVSALVLGGLGYWGGGWIYAVALATGTLALSLGASKIAIDATGVSVRHYRIIDRGMTKKFTKRGFFKQYSSLEAWSEGDDKRGFFYSEGSGVENEIDCRCRVNTVAWLNEQLKRLGMYEVGGKPSSPPVQGETS